MAASCHPFMSLVFDNSVPFSRCQSQYQYHTFYTGANRVCDSHSFYPIAKKYECHAFQIEGTRKQSLVAHAANSKEEDQNMASEIDLSVFRFTLGIPGFDESNLPRVIGIVCGLLLGLNHILSQNSATPAQLRSEAVGLVLASIAVCLPFAGRLLKGMSVSRPQDFPADCRQVFLMSENLSIDDKEDLAWGSYTLLRNTISMSVLIFHSEVLCARGFWDMPTEASNDDIFNLFKGKIEQLGLSHLTTTLYFANNADEQGWEIIPKGAASLLVQPFNCRILSDENITNLGGFVFLISRVPQAYGDKERAWVAALANKFENIRHTRSE